MSRIVNVDFLLPSKASRVAAQADACFNEDLDLCALQDGSRIEARLWIFVLYSQDCISLDREGTLSPSNSGQKYS